MTAIVRACVKERRIWENMANLKKAEENFKDANFSEGGGGI